MIGKREAPVKKCVHLLVDVAFWSIIGYGCAFLLLVFSNWPSFFPDHPIDDYGFICAHFVQLYVIAGYLKLHVDKGPKKAVCALCFLASVILIFYSVILEMGCAYA